MKDVTRTGSESENFVQESNDKVFFDATILNALRQGKACGSIQKERAKRMKDDRVVNWEKVERLCLKSFCGGLLSSDEQSELERAYRLFPDEYSKRTNSVREEERSRIRSF